MKKVLMVSCEGLGRGGVQAVMMNIVRNLKGSFTFDMLLFTNDKRYYDDEFLTYGGKIIRIPHYNGICKIRRKLDYYLRGRRLYKKVLKVLKENKGYSAIHCHNSFESSLCIKAAKKVNIPIRIVHSHTCSTYSNALQKHLHKIYQKMIIKYSTQRIACTDEAGRALFGKGGMYTTVRNPYDDSRFHFMTYKSKDNLNGFSITQIGMYGENKNQLFSIEVLNEIRNSGIEATLNLVGFGDYQKVIQEKVDDLKLNDFVKMYPADADTPKLLSESSFFLFPSLQEGFGIVLIEAQAVGVKCYVSDTVPRTTNAGGCVYLPLSKGAEYWAKEIISDWKLNGGEHCYYDCSEFCQREFCDNILNLYGGE